jgi:hypothetical protein
MTADSFGISLSPASPRGNARCAIDIQINIAIPPRTPARRIFIRKLMVESDDEKLRGFD